MEKDLKESNTKINTKSTANSGEIGIPLKASDTIYRKILDSSPDPLFVTDATHILYTNKSGAVVLRSTPNEIIGKLMTELIPSPAINGIAAIMVRHFKGEKIADKYEIKLPIGEKHFIHLEAHIRFIDFEGKTAILTSMRDISSLKHYQERLEFLHKHAIELENAATEQEIVTISGKTLSNTLNYETISIDTIEDGYLIDVFSLFPDKDFKLHMDVQGITTRAARTQETQFILDTLKDEDYVIGSNEIIFRSEIAVPVVSQGKTVAVINVEKKELNAFSLQDKELLETLGSHMSSAYDRINQIHNLEQQIKERTEQLRKTELKYQSIIDATKLGLLEIDVASGTVWFPDYLFNILGIEKTPVLGFDKFLIVFLDKIHEKDRELVSNSLNKAVHDFQPSEFEYRRFLDGSYYWYRGIVNIIGDSGGKPEKVVAMSVGISEIKTLQQRLEKQNKQLMELDEMKNQFISTATHELRTPVTSILGFLEIVLDDTNRDIPDSVRKDLNVVFRNANRLVTLTNDLLDVQRITSGRFEVQLEPVDLVDTLNEVVEELTPLFDANQQALQVEAPDALIANVDETRISQLFINLLRNANKFTPDEGNITVSVEPIESHVIIAVKDSGIGLNEEDIEKLFKPFPGIRHGLDVSSTGLGLSICKGIVDMHNGEIWAESDGSGEGSIFYVKIPI